MNDIGEETVIKKEIKLEEPRQIANKFNEYFATIGSKLASEIKYSGNKSINSYLKRNIGSTFSLQIVTEEVITETIKSLTTKKVVDMTNCPPI